MTKKEYTQIFLAQAGLECTDASVKEWLTKIWAVPLSPLGYRLTHQGSQFLINTLKLENFKCKIKDDFNDSYKMMLAMSKHITAPFYLTPPTSGPRTLICFGETDRFMLALMGGDLEQYLVNFERE